MDFKGSWVDYLTLVEFSYNNNFQSSIGMAPFEALSGRKCRSPIFWDEVGQKMVTRPKLVQKKVTLTKEHLCVAQDR